MLTAANTRLARLYPGDATARQPVHTFIGGGDAFTRDASRRAGAQAIQALELFAPTPRVFADAIGVSAKNVALTERMYTRVREKLEREPIEDFRIDFEDGYGTRPDAEEDGHVRAAAEEVAAGINDATLPPFIGIRVKPLSRELQARSLRTLDLFVTTMVKAARRLPGNFAVTLTKVMVPEHVSAAARACAALERKLHLKRGAIRLELMIETPQAILAPDGTCALPRLVKAGAGRVRGAHFGVYDYTALCGITAAWQQPRHFSCDFAREMMRVSLAQTGVMMADGGSNIMPIPPHVQAAWKTHFADVTHSLVNGFYQGWDLHPAQLPTRYAAVYAFYLSSLPAATTRLKGFFSKAEKAGAAFDDAATGQALLNFINRAVSTGAITLDEATATGLRPSELGGPSFRHILDERKG